VNSDSTSARGERLKKTSPSKPLFGNLPECAFDHDRIEAVDHAHLLGDLDELVGAHQLTVDLGCATALSTASGPSPRMWAIGWKKGMMRRSLIAFHHRNAGCRRMLRKTSITSSLVGSAMRSLPSDLALYISVSANRNMSFASSA